MNGPTKRKERTDKAKSHNTEKKTRVNKPLQDVLSVEEALAKGHAGVAAATEPEDALKEAAVPCAPIGGSLEDFE